MNPIQVKRLSRNLWYAIQKGNIGFGKSEIEAIKDLLYH